MPAAAIVPVVRFARENPEVNSRHVPIHGKTCEVECRLEDKACGLIEKEAACQQPLGLGDRRLALLTRKLPVDRRRLGLFGGAPSYLLWSFEL